MRLTGIGAARLLGVLWALPNTLIGMLAGALCGGIDLLVAPYIFNVFQVFLDYPIAFCLVGLAGRALTPWATERRA